MDKMETMDGINTVEISEFIDGLKTIGISVIVEYEKDIPAKLYYRPKECGWTGIAILKSNERINNERYCGLVLGETVDVLEDNYGNVIAVPSGKFDFIMYDAKIRESAWGKLNISDLEVYIQNAIKESKFIYRISCMRAIDGKSNMDACPVFNLDWDIFLKDYQMEVYLKGKIDAGVKIAYY